MCGLGKQVKTVLKLQGSGGVFFPQLHNSQCLHRNRWHRSEVSSTNLGFKIYASMFPKTQKSTCIHPCQRVIIKCLKNKNSSSKSYDSLLMKLNSFLVIKGHKTIWFKGHRMVKDQQEMFLHVGIEDFFVESCS